MALWIDQPIWPAHGRLFAHLVSDSSYAELHACADAAALHPWAFDGDHYDVPQERWDAAVAAGAVPVPGVELARRLNASGLRLRKRRGDRGVARRLHVPLAFGVSHVDLVASPRPVAEEQVFGAMVFVRDRDGRFAAVHSIRRGEWGSPGGWREPGETPLHTVVRETAEETGLVLDPGAVHVCGYERFTPLTPDNPIPVGAPYLQVFRAELEGRAPALSSGDDGIRATRWAPPREYAALCGHLFWWPLARAVIADLADLAA
ncbi:MAG TPA: DUF4031 domain-containing protein [Intrasporangium sp.]|uniref:DUF4031 domain-containing protein n=1 Tax=Intrasporangium sp. TaxID=1925024 RepID=UPI002D77716F|nr:DUF4031 domain-containing protein [Intrasporangium sp.]HET7399522.1 DUF4031 domain-containing protein [Intrasporangium sp.]